ncbi:UdgX family uracil-DNA binding protein [Rhizobium sp. BK650]|uniref:UdgX family uracil-DNA binding protein n=1 Tax=Rhizobium sp. BK650 TaxID=2586990 RepID=UPI001613ACBC|nr:UdgX family uracil-DNA binding protein [Rhizobium sp. BK650]
MRRVVLEGRGNFDEWRRVARAFAAAGILPDEIEWYEKSDESGFAFQRDALPPDPPANSKPMTVPTVFMTLAEAVICHSDRKRFSLLYSLLWRIQTNRCLLDLVSDLEVSRARLMQKSVHRDAHKMTAFVRFKEVAAPAGGRRKFIAWFEPDHYIVARKAPFFQRRFNDMDWLIATPKGSAAWDGERLTISNMPCEKPDISDATDDLWRTYYASIFNPARLKVKAMRAEMPKKYWKNLPEADLIPGLIANAEAKVLAMAEREATMPPPYHSRIQEAAARIPAPQRAPAGTLEALREEASVCSQCPLHAKATQTVFGEGPADAEIMFVGEQPGDQEDLAGRPFVGPAGRVFDEAIAQVGIDRSRLYVTNAVKHFKYEPRGKRRIHQKPNLGEVQHCRWWLKLEIDFIKPKVIVAMGATALYSLTGEKQKLEDLRGRPIAMEEGRMLFVTVHPSYLLRIPDEEKKARELARFRQDMNLIKGLAA